SEPYELAIALSESVARAYPGLNIKVVETECSGENLSLLSKGKVDLALIQADVITRENVALLAILYPDMFQLLVRKESNIRTIKDLEGAKIVLPPVTSGQYRAFWFLANHYGLAPERIKVVAMSEKDATEALRAGTVDAIFFVRGPRSQQIRMMVSQADLTFIPIDQAEALKLRQPAFGPGIVPKGAYRGDPPLPAEDLTTVSVDRLLVADNALSNGIVRAITSVMFEKRRELTLQTPLAALIRQPALETGTMLPVHDGALEYYDRNEPSLLEEKAEFLALLLSAAVVIGSLLIALKRGLDERKKGRIEDYAGRLIELEKESKQARTIPELNCSKEELTAILARVVDDMRNKRINAEGLQLFSFVWESVNYTVNDHEEQLRLGPAVAARLPGKTRRSRR
ncbi:MAG: TAXI family TRAP transporter solute-binding subunit, partial [Hyphomicrobiales bacterium]